MMISSLFAAAMAQDTTVPFESMLQVAIDAAPTSGPPSAYVVWIDATASREALTIPPNARLTIRPLGSGPVQLQATPGSPLFSVGADAELVVEGLELDCSGQRCFSVAEDADLFLSDSVLTNGATSGDGGMIRALGGGTLEVSRSLLEGSSASEDGGHIWADDSTVVIQDSLLLQGAAEFGGSVNIGSGTLTIDNSRIQQSSATQRGGAVRARGGATTVITDSALRGNTAIELAGGVFAQGGLVMQRSVLCENAAEDGGAIYWRPQERNVSFSVDRSAFIANTATDDGGVLWTFAVAAQSLTFSDSTFAGNTAGDNGGSIYIPGNDSDPDFEVTACSFTDDSTSPIHDNGDGSSTHSNSNFHPQSPGDEDVGVTSSNPTFDDPGFSGPYACDFLAVVPTNGVPGAHGPGGIEDQDQDGAVPPWDCDDGDDSIHPGAVDDTCNGIDDDCDGRVDEDATPDTTFWLDLDRDGLGDPEVFVTVCGTVPNDFYATNPDDCDDTDAMGGSTTPWYPDLDGDGDGDDEAAAVVACAAPAQHVANNLDCDDDDSAINLNGVEICNGLDDDCNGFDDDGVGVPWYADGDEDGFGGELVTTACTGPLGTVDNDDDCDDEDDSIRPTATEVCNGFDDDCDEQVDQQDPDVQAPAWYPDGDGDGFGEENGVAVFSCTAPSSTSATANDCDDLDPAINPGAGESCTDGVDNDCDNLIDADDPDFMAMESPFWLDQDGDGVGTSAEEILVCSGAIPPDYVSPVLGDDCDDMDAGNTPGNDEICDAQDNDCDGAADNGFPRVDWYEDLDDDGFGGEVVLQAPAACPSLWGVVEEIEEGDDCADEDPNRNPGATEVCNGVDDDCDGLIDDADMVQGTAWYADVDGDGYGTDVVVFSCVQPPSTSALSDDCDDLDASVNPAAVEACPDEIDNDCDQLVDAADPDYTADEVPFWLDEDGDGVGTSGQEVLVCSGDAPDGYVPASAEEDCDDTDPTNVPGGTEVCDARDNNCDGVADDTLPRTTWYEDLDGDTFGGAVAREVPADCPELWGLTDEVDIGGDCADNDPSRNPAATEVCNGVDDDCNGIVDDGFETTLWWIDADGDGLGDGSMPPMEGCGDPPPGSADNGDDCDDSVPGPQCEQQQQTLVDTGCRCSAGGGTGGGLLLIIGLALGTIRRR